MKTELVDRLSKFDLETLGRWYCDLNCYRLPQGFPVDIGDVFQGCDSAMFKTAFDVVSELLGDAECSRAWWIYQLGRTEEEWRAWWSARITRSWSKPK